MIVVSVWVEGWVLWWGFSSSDVSRGVGVFIEWSVRASWMCSRGSWVVGRSFSASWWSWVRRGCVYEVMRLWSCMKVMHSA